MKSSIYESFILPSKGLIYDKKINPEVSIRSMTVLEEMRRLSPTSKDLQYKQMCDIIEDCLETKPEISVYDMCLGDYQFLLYKLRIVTYGSDYKMSGTCPTCKDYVEVNADLDTLSTIEYDEDKFNEERFITLPVSGNKIELKFQTPRDLDEIERKQKEMQRKSKMNIDYSMLYTVMSLIKSVDGQVLSEIKIEDYVRKLNMKDINTLLRAGNKLNGLVGIDNSVVAKCKKCDTEMVIPFLITSEFYGPTA